MLTDLTGGLPATAPLFAALGDETRLSLVEALSTESPQSISRLAADATMSRQAITKHLQVLEHAGIVRGVRVGRENLFEFRPARLSEAAAYLAHVSEQWDDALSRFKAFVEK